MNQGLTVYLNCCRSKLVSPSEVKITDGCHGDSVVWVIVLYRLCCTGYHIFQIIVNVLWEVETGEGEKKKKSVQILKGY